LPLPLRISRHQIRRHHPHGTMLRRASATAIAAIIGDAEQDARRAVAELVRHRRCGPALLRLAFHDAATFDVASHTGGANASIR